MKKYVGLFITLALCLALCACGNCKHKMATDQGYPATCTTEGMTDGQHCTLCGEVLVPQQTISALGHTESVLPAVPATCTNSGLSEGKECSVCKSVLVQQETVGVLGHTTAAGTCENCGLEIGDWTINYYVDDFKQPTEEGYVITKNYISGTFSNSATTDSMLLVQPLVDQEDIVFFLYEYGTHQVKNSSSRYVDEYDITMRREDGSQSSLTGTVYCGGDRLFIDDKYKDIVLEALLSGETVSFYIVDAEYTTSTYLFTVPTSDFAIQYEKLV